MKQVLITHAVRLQVAQSKITRDSGQKKMQTGVLELFLQFKANGNSFVIPDSVNDDLIQPSYAKVDLKDNVYTYIHALTIEGVYISKIDFVQQLQSKGVSVTDTSNFDRIHFVQGWIPAEKFDAVSQLNVVAHIALVTEPLISAAPKGSERIRSDVANQVWGDTGKGVTIGVISDDCGSLKGDCPFSTTQSLLEQQQGLSPCPLGNTASTEVIDDGWDGRRGHEGLAMMEIIHEVAPGAKVKFATGLGRLDPSGTGNMGMINLFNSINSLAPYCNVITDDVLYLEEPAFEDGFIAKRMDELSGDLKKPLVFTSAAGNWAKDVYSFSFVPLPNQFIGSSVGIQPFTIHDNVNQDYKSQFTIPQGGKLTVMLQWDDAYSEGTSDNDFDLYLVDIASNKVVETSTNSQDNLPGHKSIPFELIEYYSNPCYGSQGYKLFITQYAVKSNPTPRMKLVILGTNDFNDLPKAKSIFGHTAAASCISCGAMGADGNYNYVEDWSSQGPVEIVQTKAPVNASGHRPLKLQIDDSVRHKPNVSSMDGVLTQVPNFESFSGTSAAAPYAAAIAALLISFDKGFSSQEVMTYMQHGCIGNDNPEIPNNISGYGRTDAFESIAFMMALKNPTSHFWRRTNGLSTLAPGMSQIQLAGISFIPNSGRMYVSATFEGNLPANVILKAGGIGGVGGTDIPLISTSYTAKSLNTVLASTSGSSLPLSASDPIMGLFRVGALSTITPADFDPTKDWTLTFTPSATTKLKDWAIYFKR